MAHGGRRRDSPAARRSQGWPRRTQPRARPLTAVPAIGDPVAASSPALATRPVPFRVIPALGPPWAPYQRRGQGETQPGTRPAISAGYHLAPAQNTQIRASASSSASSRCPPITAEWGIHLTGVAQLRGLLWEG